MTTPTLWTGRRERFALLFAMYLVRALLGAWAVWPIAEANLPSLDLLFRPGGLYLLEALRIGRSEWVEVVPRLLLAMLATGFFGLWPTAAWLYAHCLRTKPKVLQFLTTSFRLFGSLAFLGVMVLVLKLALGLLVVFTLPSLAGLMDLRSAVFAALGILSGALVSLVLLGIVHDLARAHLVRHDASAWASLRAGFRAMGFAPLIAWAWRTFLGLLFIGLAAWLSSLLGDANTLTSVAGLFFQQLALFGIVALRASFLIDALQRVSSPSRAVQTVFP